MDSYLIPACILLALTSLSFALLGLYWKHQATQAEHAALQMGLTISRATRAAHDAAWDECKRHTLGLVYRVATRAEREGRDAFAALKEISKAAEAESVVQVPIEG